MWEKFQERLPHEQPKAIFSMNEDYDSLEENSASENSEEYDSDSSELPTVSKSLSSLPLIKESKPWENSTQQEHLRIIMNNVGNFDSNKRSLRSDLSRQGLKWKDEEEEVRPWYFGLKAIRLEFTKPKEIDIPMLILSVRIPFWLKFKTEKQKPMVKDNTPKKTIHHKLTPDLDVSLRYGALIDLNKFRHQPDDAWTRGANLIWSFALDDVRSGGYIEWIIDYPQKETGRKKQLLLSNIDQTVIVDTNDKGFDIYICQKCNLNEFEPKETEKSKQQPKRYENKSQSFSPMFGQPKKAALLMPSKSCTPKTDRNYPTAYNRIGERGGCYFPTIQFSVHINAPTALRNDGKSVQDRMKQTLSLFIEFFLAHRIAVCYGKINSDPGPEPHLFFQPNIPDFPSLIMKYSWQMLSINGYRLQLQIDRQFQNALFDIHRKEQNPEELFYRVCVYLSRICSLKPFLDINQELQHAIDESKRKRDHAAYGLVRKLDFEGTNAVYVPSVTITPTTIRVKPLKLCRTNRVLRATEQFGKPVEHFILVDVRDENGKPIQSYHFGHLRQQLLDSLRKGFTLMGDDRQYKYLHHSQSQLRQRQFWFYHYEGNRKNLSFTDAYKWMGNFDKEKNPAKHAARIALCFSTTTATVEVRIEDYFIYISK